MVYDRRPVLWSLFFRAMYRGLRFADPVLRVLWRRRIAGLGRIVDVRVPGRGTGIERRTLVTMLDVDGRSYIGHPNGRAEWTRNVEAAGVVELRFPGRESTESPAHLRSIRLYGGPERESVIRATWSQQPFPANIVYALARRHVREVGVYFRLVPLPPAASSEFGLRAAPRGASI